MNEAFQRLNDAYAWAKDQKAWETRQLENEQHEVIRQAWNHWLLSGGELRRAEMEEEVGRQTVEAEEALHLLLNQAQHEWEELK